MTICQSLPFIIMIIKCGHLVEFFFLASACSVCCFGFLSNQNCNIVLCIECAMLHFIQWSELANPCGPIINIIIIYSRHTVILPLKFMHKQPHSTHRSQQSCPGRCAIQFNSHFTFMNRLQNRVQPHENRSAFIYIVYRHYKSDYDNRYGLCIRAPLTRLAHSLNYYLIVLISWNYTQSAL